VIVTYLAVSRLEVLDTDVLVWAGCEYSPAFKEFPPRGAERQRTILLVDLADDFDSVAKAAVRSRLHNYIARGWASVGAPCWATAGDRMEAKRHSRKAPTLSR
jgi:hypothetical protein